MKKILLVLIIYVLLFPILTAEDRGKLEEFEDELNKPVQHDNHDHDHDHDEEEEDNDNDLYSNIDDEDDYNVLVKIFLYLTYEVLIGSEPPLNYYRLPARIYQDGFTGRYSLNGNSYDADLEIKYIYNSDTLDGISVNGNFFFLNAFNLKLLLQNFEETKGNVLDKMNYYELFIDYYRCRLPRLNWYWGLGVKGLGREDDYLGFAMNTGLEVYPFKPISFELAANVGWLDAHPVTKLNAGFKIHSWKLFISSEFQRLQAGSSAINSINFGLGFNY